MRAALLILAKDLRQRSRDRTVWIVGLIAPLVLAGLLGVIVGGFGPASVGQPRWGALDQDGGEVGASLITRVLPVVAAALDGEVQSVADAKEAARLLDDGQLDAVFILPVGLTATVLGGGTAEIEVLGRVGHDLSNAIAEAVAREWAGDVAITRAALLALALQNGEVPRVGAAGLRAPNLAMITDLHGADRTLDGSTYVAAGMGVFFLFFTVGLGVIGLLEEKTNGTLARLHASPNPRWSVVAGKVLTSIVIGWLATVTLMVATTFLLGASWGPTVPVLVLISVAVLAAVSLVTVVAGFAESADSASNVQSIIGIVLGMLGGAFFPVATEPGALATASDLTPHGMFLTAIGDLQVPGAGLGDIAPQLLGLLSFALVTVAAGGVIGRLREVA